MKIIADINKVELQNFEPLISGAYRDKTIDVELSPEYDGLSVWAIFDRQSVKVEGGKCYTPTLDRGTCAVGIYAVRLNNENKIDLRYSPVPALINIEQGSYSTSINSAATPTITEAEQIYALIDEAIKAGMLKGEKGEPGPKGEKGDKGEQGIPGKDAYQFFKTISTGKDLSQFVDGVYLATKDIVITNKNATNKELLIYENTFFIVENIMLISKNKLTFYGSCVFDGENKPYSAYQFSEVDRSLSDVSAYTSLLTEINNLRTDTENRLQEKQEKLTAGAGIKIDNNIISADTQFSLIKASGRREEGYTYPVPDVDNPKSNAIYLVPIESPEIDDDYHYEWLWDDSYQNGAWELLGTTSLSAIPKKTSQLENDSNFVSDSDYVHTDNNYTNADKNKLASLSNYNDTEIKKSIAEKQDKFTTGTGLILENGILSLDIPIADSDTVYGGV